MIKKILFPSLLLLISNSIFAQFYTQYFDGKDTSQYYSIFIQKDTSKSNIWEIGKPQKKFFREASTLPNALITDAKKKYPKNNKSIFTTKMKPWTPGGIFVMQWEQKLDMDKHHAGGIIEYSLGKDSAWHNVFNNPYVYKFYGFEDENRDTLPSGQFAFSGQDTIWRNIWLCFTFSFLKQNKDSVAFRFTFVSDSLNTNKEGWMIDNFRYGKTYLHTVKDVSNGKYVNIYPNPANEIINIELEKLPDFHIIEYMKLINSQGQILEEWKNIPTKFYFDTARYSNGVYFLMIKSNLKSETVPIVIQQN